jgi:hypothetical protein
MATPCGDTIDNKTHSDTWKRGPTLEYVVVEGRSVAGGRR